MSPVSPMTWKSTALLTGVTALATWLAAPATPPATSRRVGVPAQAPVSSTIEVEAARLSARTPSAALPTVPRRNPFEFEPRAAGPAGAASGATPVASPVATLPPEVVALEAWPVVRLTGLASDVVAGVPQRIAIFSSRDGVLLVREGETVLDRYRVTRIDDDGVEIARLEDGLSRRISLAP